MNIWSLYQGYGREIKKFDFTFWGVPIKSDEDEFVTLLTIQKNKNTGMRPSLICSIVILSNLYNKIIFLLQQRLSTGDDKS